jgi:hypothetical protein
MADTGRPRTVSEVLRKGYTDEEIANVYELGRLFLEAGFLKKGETIMAGITAVAPHFSPGWLGLSYCAFMQRATEKSLDYAREAYRADPGSARALLFLVSCFLALNDINGAGTYLGELREQLESGSLQDPEVRRLYEAHLARFTLRGQDN